MGASGACYGSNEVVTRRVLFIADQFDEVSRGATERYPGGAELTDAAAIEAAPWPVEVARVSDLDVGRLSDFDLLIIGNLERATPEVCRAIVRHGRHVAFEHDYRACRWRGDLVSTKDQVHRWAHRCRCRIPERLELLATARTTIFLTQRQLAFYSENPYVQCGRPVVLGCSLMDRRFFSRVDAVRRAPPAARSGTLVLQLAQRYKGTPEALAWCRAQGIEPDLAGNLSPPEVLDRFERASRFVYLPISMEPAGRVLVEARFLGCEIVTNGHAGVTGESWWHLPDAAALEVLRDGPARFWRLIQAALAEEAAPAPAPMLDVAIGAALAVRFAGDAAAWHASGRRRAAARDSTIDVLRREPAGPSGSRDGDA